MTELLDANIVKRAVKKLPTNSDKFSVGTLLSICGSYSMAGACIMSGKGALRSGAGLLRMIVPDSIYPIVAPSLCEAVFCPVRDGENPANISFLEKLNNNNAVLIGCGLSVTDYTGNLVKTVLEKTETPTILDADALNIISKSDSIKQLLKSVKAPVIITPHIGEFSRLTGLPKEEILKNKESAAKAFAAEYGTIVVLKSNATVIASPDGRILCNETTGNPGMAKGGSGDVLAGIISSLVAQGGDPFYSASAGVYIHGLSGDIAAKQKGQHSMLPTDLIECIPLAFKQLGL